MNISTRTVDSVVILDLKGRLTVEEDTQPLRDMLSGLTELEFSHFILNLREVYQLDCCGIGQLVLCFRRVRDRGGKLKLVKLPERLRRLLEMTRLLTVIEVFDDEKKALASFPGASTYDPRVQSFEIRPASNTPFP